VGGSAAGAPFGAPAARSDDDADDDTHGGEGEE
jgi:hypothetical protein